ncbi:Titin isoform X20 [Oopsacas minuta]|uniref:Titin isoform X20 n=1 Tax=Oopsacas minuta TaxID=111878 RepID=A0AAV7KJZ4_9METZ|nr:Titin isoform X20 [Oopsacas minuta]
MFSLISRQLSYLVLLALLVCSLHAAIELSFFNDIPNTPQETIVFASDSLFYTGGLAHIDEFICTSDSPSTETVLWFDARGNEVSIGDGSGTSLYWTGTTSNKTLHTSDSSGNNLIDVENQGNNFTCRVDETSEEKVLGIYWVRSILDADGEVNNQLEGMRIYTKDDPPKISEFTLQRGFFDLDFSKQYKVQSLIGSTSITISPAPIEPAIIPPESIIDNVTFSNSRYCHFIGTSSNDFLYTTLFNGDFIPSTSPVLSLPQFGGATCIENGKQTSSFLGDIIPNLRFICPLVFNGNFINIDNLNLLTENEIVASSPPELPQINGRRLWVDFVSSMSISLRYDREYVCEDMYGTRLSFNLRVKGNYPLEILVSDLANDGILVGTNYINTEIPEILYCLAETDNTPITWLSETTADYTASVSALEVTNRTSIIPYRITPRAGRSDMFLNSTIALDREGYYTCSDGGTNDIRVGIFSLNPEAPIALVTPSESSQNISIINPINITCGVVNNSTHPPPIFFWTGPRTSSTGLLDTTGFQETDSGDYTCHSSNVVGGSNVTISILIVVPPPMLVATTDIPEYYFKDDKIQLFCNFSIAPNLESIITISWYMDSILIMNNSNGFHISETTLGEPWNYQSVLCLSSAIPSNTGQYTCSATVGRSNTTTSPPFNIEIEAAYLPDAAVIQFNRIGPISAHISWTATNRTRLTPEIYVVSYCQLPACDSYIESAPLSATYFFISEIIVETNYSVRVDATNRYGSVVGASRNFTTLFDRTLYFYDVNREAPSTTSNKTYFASGSVFRGGDIDYILFLVQDFYCVPQNPTTDIITWYAPDGELVTQGFVADSFFYTVDANGESTLYLNNALTASNDGRNFTCRINSNGFLFDYYFGVYFILDVYTTRSFGGNRLFSKDNPPVVREFVAQRGSFDIDLTQTYDVESLQSPSYPSFDWTFVPSLASPVTVPDMNILTDALFNDTSTCQLGYSSISGDFFSFSDKQFVIQTPVGNFTDGPPLIGSACIEDNTIAYVFTIGSGVDIAVVCPLLYGASFLDISPTQFIQYEYILNDFGNNSRRLLVDPARTSAVIAHERSYVCQDRYGTRSTFGARVDAITELQVFDSDTTTIPVSNNGMHITNQITLYCLSNSNLLEIEWYFNTNPNSSEVTYTLVSNDSMLQPYVSNPRAGRSDLIVSTKLPSNRQGYFYCRDSMDRMLNYSIFSQTPVSPVAVISLDVAQIQVIIGIDQLLVCGFSNSPHPNNTISYWEGTTSDSMNTILLLEMNSQVFTCISSNVFGQSTATIEITVIPPAPQEISSSLTTEGDIFITDTVEIVCEFSTLQNVTSSILIQWYHNNSLSVETGITTVNGRSTLIVSGANVSHSGDYHCVATVGGSLPTNSSPIQVTVYDAYAPDVISLTLSSITVFTAVVSWSGTIRDPELPETYSIAFSRVGSSEKVIHTAPMGSTTLKKSELLPNSEYEVHLNATNRFFTTQGSTALFKTSILRLYFMKGNEIIPIGAGSIFRGGIGSRIFDYVSEYHCFPDSPEQVITWYQPNGDVIPPGSSFNTGFYHIRNSTTGKSVFYPNDAVSFENEGNNYTCSFMGNSGEIVRSQFGIYYTKAFFTFTARGMRLYGPEDLIYEFVWQRGVFDFNFTQNYTIECLRDTLAQKDHWLFAPSSNTNTETLNVTLYDVQFDPTATCQYARCAPFSQFIAFSDKPFFIETTIPVAEVTVVLKRCLANNYEFNFQIGDSIDIRVTCPLVFGARFLDIGSDITLIQNEYTTDNPRRLYFDPVTIATLQQDREFVCEDMYGVRASFRVIVNGVNDIQVFASANSTVPETNDTNLIGESNIPDSLFCITGDASNAANWYVDSNPNRNTAESGIAVTADSTQLPYVLSPRTGRSDLVLSGTIRDEAEGYYSCVTNPQITLGIFLEQPIAPEAVITGNEESIEVVIGITTPILVCDKNNSPYPNPIYFWTGSVNSFTYMLDTSLLLESDSGVYTCTASNVVGLSSDTVTITVIPPPPQFVSIQLVAPLPVYVGDPFILQCQFSTLANVTSQINIDWYRDGTLLANSGDDSIVTTNAGSETTSELTVSNSMIILEDYQCRSTVGASQQTDSVTYTFNFTPPPTPMISVNPVDPPDLYVTQTINITCQVTTLARFQSGLRIVWYQNGSMLSTNGNVQISIINLDDTTTESTLSFGDLVLVNTGAYRCVAQVLSVLNSEAVSITTNIQVVQIPAPQFVSIQLVTPLPVYFSDPFTLQCQFSTLAIVTSQIVINWYRDGTLLTNSSGDSIVTTNTGNEAISKLTVSNSTTIQGDYQCKSKVGASQQTVSDTYTFNITPPPTPMISVNPVDPPDLYVTQTINITCQVTTLAVFRSGLRIVWYYNGSILNSNGSVSISTMNLNDTNTESTLTFGDIVLGNTGAYRCVAQVLSVLNSEAVSNTTNISVVQIPAPQFYSIQLVTTPPIYVNDIFTLQCQFSTVHNIKPQIVINWYRDGTLLANSGDDSIVTTNTENEATSELTVSNSMNIQEDYQCRSTVGASQQTDSVTYTFNFTSPPTPMISVNPVDPPDLYVTQTINITCQVTTLARFQSGLRIVWYQDGSMLSTNGNVQISIINLDDTTTESTLTFEDLVLGNTGAYHCVAQVLSVLNSEEGMSSTTNISVVQIPAPQFYSIQLVTTPPIYVNDIFTLQCQFSTVHNIKPQIVINWYRDGTLLANSGDDSIVTTNTENEATSELTVSNSINIQEDYQCRSTVGASQQTVSVTYTFNFTPPPTPMISVNPVDPPDLYVTQTINITCQVTTLAVFHSGLSIVWYFNGSILNSNGSVSIFTMNLNITSTESTLMLADLVLSNTGAYHCVAQVLGVLNSEEGVSSTTNVQVNLPPAAVFNSISSLTEDTILIGEELILVCEFTILSQFLQYLSINWYHSNTLLTASSNVLMEESVLGSDMLQSILTITNTAISNSGMYSCKATLLNYITTTSSLLSIEIVAVPTPMFVSIYASSQDPVYISDSFSLSCEFIISSMFISSLSIIWFHNDTTITSFSNIMITSSKNADNAVSTLSVSNAGLDKSGSYSCGASIPESIIQYSTLLQVNVLPIPAPEYVSIGLSKKPVYINASFQLYCTFNALTRILPYITINWYHNSTEVTSCHSRFLININHDNVRILNSTLSVQSSEECQAGAYHCDANFDQLNSVSENFQLSFNPDPYEQEITSLNVSSNNDKLYLQWTISKQPIADEYFRIKIIMQAADGSLKVTETILPCDVTCQGSKDVIYELTDIVINSLYLAEVTVINLYGQQSRIYIFDPQAILTDVSGTSQCPDVNISIVVPLIIIIMILISVIMAIFIIFIIWYVKFKKIVPKSQCKPMQSDKDYIGMSSKESASHGYYNLGPNRATEGESQFHAERTIIETNLEPTYAHIDEDGKVFEIEGKLIGEEKRDGDYEIMKCGDDPQSVTYSNLS